MKINYCYFCLNCGKTTLNKSVCSKCGSSEIYVYLSLWKRFLNRIDNWLYYCRDEDYRIHIYSKRRLEKMKIKLLAKKNKQKSKKPVSTS